MSRTYIHSLLCTVAGLTVGMLGAVLYGCGSGRDDSSEPTHPSNGCLEHRSTISQGTRPSTASRPYTTLPADNVRRIAMPAKPRNKWVYESYIDRFNPDMHGSPVMFSIDFDLQYELPNDRVGVAFYEAVSRVCVLMVFDRDVSMKTTTAVTVKMFRLAEAFLLRWDAAMDIDTQLLEQNITAYLKTSTVSNKFEARRLVGRATARFTGNILEKVDIDYLHSTEYELPYETIKENGLGAQASLPFESRGPEFLKFLKENPTAARASWFYGRAEGRWRQARVIEIMRDMP